MSIMEKETDVLLKLISLTSAGKIRWRNATESEPSFSMPLDKTTARTLVFQLLESGKMLVSIGSGGQVSGNLLYNVKNLDLVKNLKKCIMESNTEVGSFDEEYVLDRAIELLGKLMEGV